MPFGVVAAEFAPEILGGLEGAGAFEGMGAMTGGLDMFSSEAGMGLTEEFGGSGLGDVGGGLGLDGAGYDASTGLYSGESGTAGSSTYGTMGGAGTGMGAPGGWMSYLTNPQYLGLGMMGLSMLNSRNTSRRNDSLQRQALERQLQRQALMDNPPPFAKMNGPGLTPTNNWGANADARPQPSFSYADLKNYGAGPEKHWAARGGLAEHTPTHGGLEQARMVDHPEGGGQEDNVPAMLSPKEYVLDADTVASLGDGNPDEGARRLDEFRERLRRHKRGAPAHRIPPKAHPIESYMRRVA